jgi:hypothetical protein
MEIFASILWPAIDCQCSKWVTSTIGHLEKYPFRAAATPFACNRSTISHKCRTERAKRSIFVTSIAFARNLDCGFKLLTRRDRAYVLAEQFLSSRRFQIPDLRFKTGDLFNGRSPAMALRRYRSSWLSPVTKLPDNLFAGSCTEPGSSIAVSQVCLAQI